MSIMIETRKVKQLLVEDYVREETNVCLTILGSRRVRVNSALEKITIDWE